MRYRATTFKSWLLVIVIGIAGLPEPGTAADEAGKALRVDGARLNATMEHMKTFGMSDTGGSTRVAFSGANRTALSYLSSLMMESGLMPRIDVGGNLVGQREGKVGVKAKSPGLRRLSPALTSTLFQTAGTTTVSLA